MTRPAEPTSLPSKSCCPSANQTLFLAAILSVLWHAYNLQKLDRWIHQVLVQQYEQNQQQWVLQRKAVTHSQHGRGELANRTDLIFASKKNGHGRQFLTTTSGCRMARWVYPTSTPKKRYRDCHNTPREKLLLPYDNSSWNSLLQPYDTIYVTLQKLPMFVAQVLPSLHVDVVILSGQIYKIPPLPESVVRSLVEHPHVVHWFCQNLNIHFQNHNRLGGQTFDHKVSPFPYGIKETTHKHHTRDGDALHDYQTIYFQSLAQNSKRNDNMNWTQRLGVPTIYAGPLHPWPHRLAKAIPGTAAATGGSSNSNQYLSPLEYYSEMSRHDYVLSPNGDRPECYRHYEAIGLGVVPITELGDEYFYHLKGSVLFNNIEWNITKLQQKLRHFPASASRDMILEEYWMDYVEARAGRSLTWWDRSRGRNSASG